MTYCKMEKKYRAEEKKSHIVKSCNSHSDTKLEDNQEPLNVFLAEECHNVINFVERYFDESLRSWLKCEEGWTSFYLGAYCKHLG